MINFRSLQALFQRYSALHRSIPSFPRKVHNPQGNLIARIENERTSGNMHKLKGWTFAQQIIIATPDRVLMTLSPTVSRRDVQQAYGGRLQSGFDIQIPMPAQQCTISFVRDGQTVTCALCTPNRMLRSLENIRLMACLAWGALRGLPAMRTYLTTTSMSQKEDAKQRLKHHLGLGSQQQNRDHLFGCQDLGSSDTKDVSKPPPTDRLTLVLPVYNAYELLRECLDRVSTHTDLEWHLIIIEDCSTDDRILPFLREWSDARPVSQVTLLENQTNLGFIGSVNRGLRKALALGDPVVLLNSDALVPRGWASRLLAPLRDETIASTTPMSNDAEILNAPIICRPSPLAQGEADAIDVRAQELLSGAPYVDLPTGVGFCMAISPAWLARVPQLDTVFGRGYGEEVDWCRKIMQLGGRHVNVPDLFIEHRGGESFGSDEKLSLIAANGEIITKRYPKFDAEVQEFIANDPLIGPRLMMGLLRIAATSQRVVPVYLCHSLGGGADDATLRRIADDLKQGMPSVVIRVGGRFRYALELHTQQGVSFGQTNDSDAIARMLRALPRREIIYVCGVGDLDAATLAQRLVRWSDDDEARLTIEFHDFFPLCPSYTLLDRSGRFEWPPKPDPKNVTSSYSYVDIDGVIVALSDWQMRWHDALDHAEKIVVFSTYSRDLVADRWPDLESKIHVVPHPPLYKMPQVQRQPAMPARTIGVLGNIGFQKGAGALAQMCQHLSKKNGESLVIIGNIDPTYPLPSVATIHGNYAREDVAMLAERYSIDCWLIPSIWPETFSFTTREALATGLPVWCFDLGAQAEALHSAGQGDHVLPIPATSDDFAATVQRILQRG